jgi:TolA-binding protein
MDNKQLIHIACEGIVIGSVSLYFAKQLKKANKEIEELKEIISKNQGANEKRFEVLFNILDSLNSQPSQAKIEPKIIKKKVTIQEAPTIQVQKRPVEKKKQIVKEELIEEDVPENSTQLIGVVEDDEVVDLEEETRSLLEEDVEEDIEA